MKQWLSLLFCTLVYAKMTEIVQHHRYRVEYAYCAEDRTMKGRTTYYPSEITVYRENNLIAKFNGALVMGRRGTSRTRKYIEQALKQ
jgi:hypothetical protein